MIVILVRTLAFHPPVIDAQAERVREKISSISTPAAFFAVIVNHSRTLIQ